MGCKNLLRNGVWRSSRLGGLSSPVLNESVFVSMSLLNRLGRVIEDLPEPIVAERPLEGKARYEQNKTSPWCDNVHNWAGC